MIRSIIAVIAGLVVVMGVFAAGTAALAELIIPGGSDAARAGAAPDTYIAASLVLTAVAAVLGGWVTARMAPGREMIHVVALALLVALKSVPPIVGYGNPDGLQPQWYIYSVLLADVAGVVFGGWLRSRVIPAEPR